MTIIHLFQLITLFSNLHDARNLCKHWYLYENGVHRAPDRTRNMAWVHRAPVQNQKYGTIASIFE